MNKFPYYFFLLYYTISFCICFFLFFLQADVVYTSTGGNRVRSIARVGNTLLVVERHMKAP